MKRQKLSKSSGFTLLELLVVVVMIGILAAIAAPSWLAFINQQRVGTARNQLSQALRNAQAEAKRKQVCQAVIFDDNNKQPRFAIEQGKKPENGSTRECTVPPPTAISNWQNLGNGDIRPNVITLLVKQASSSAVTAKPETSAVLFDNYGNVMTTSPAQPTYTITVGTVASTNPRRCVVIRTLLGAIDEASDKDCD